MKILYFSRDYTTHDFRFLSKLAGTHHKVYYLRLERRGPQVEPRSLPPQIEIVDWSGGKAPATLRDAPRLVRELRGILQRIRPDVVHAGPLQRSALIAALTGARPLVAMSWGYDLLQDAAKNRWWSWATRYTLKRSAAFVGDCAVIRSLAVAYGMAPECIVTFPWGVDLAHFNPAARPPRKAGEPFTLLSTRSWEPIYGVETIAEAFVRAVRQRPQLRLMMLGGGALAGSLRRTLDRLETGSTVEPRVLFPGQIGYADLPRFYRSADLYLSASHSDGSSISLLEAMACGCPALVSDIPGNREWITPGENGWLFSAGDAAALAQAIVEAVDRGEMLAEMGCAARKIAEKRADWDNNFPRLLDAYQIALGRTSPGG